MTTFIIVPLSDIIFNCTMSQLQASKSEFKMFLIYNYLKFYGSFPLNRWFNFINLVKESYHYNFKRYLYRYISDVGIRRVEKSECTYECVFLINFVKFHRY